MLLYGAAREIGGEGFIDDLRRLVQRVELVVGNEAAFVGREIQDEISVAPNGCVICQAQAAAG